MFLNLFFFFFIGLEYTFSELETDAFYRNRVKQGSSNLAHSQQCSPVKGDLFKHDAPSECTVISGQSLTLLDCCAEESWRARLESP